LSFFEAVPNEVWWDNPKKVAIFRGRSRQLNRQYSPLASQLEEAQWKSGLDRLLGKLDELNLLITSNLAFSDWGQVFQEKAKAETPNSGLHPKLKKASLSR